VPERAHQEALDRATGYFEECIKDHARFVSGVDERYNAYLGFVGSLNDPSQVAHHPPFVMRAVESTLASLIDDELSFTVKQRMMLLDPRDQRRQEEAVKANQALSDWQVRQSCLSDEQREFNLQHAVAGLTVCKNFWVTETETRKHMVRHEDPITDPMTGGPLIGPDGQPQTTVSYDTVTRPTVVYDGPWTETVDVRDFGWHQAAPSLKKARYVWHRVWMDAEDILDAVDQGRFGPKRGGWPRSEVAELLAGEGGFHDKLPQREMSLYNQDRTKDKQQVVEAGTRSGRGVTFANNGIPLAALDEFPFWHNDVPFVVCSAQPGLFRIPGISQVKADGAQKMRGLSPCGCGASS
jgi:hypothetical protein